MLVKSLGLRVFLKLENRLTYIGDVVESNILAARSEISGETFNIAGGTRITINELIGRIEKTVRRQARVKYVGRQKGDVGHTWASLDKAEKALGWKPKVSIDRGLENFIKWLSLKEQR